MCGSNYRFCVVLRPCQDGFTPVGVACYQGHEGVVKQLLASGATLSERDVKLASDRGHTVVAGIVRTRVGVVGALNICLRWILLNEVRHRDVHVSSTAFPELY